MTITKKSAKAKGNKLETIVANFYARKLDSDAKRMPRSGAVEGFKADVLKRFYDGWKDECKWRKKMAIYDFWQQAQEQGSSNDKPVLHIKADNKPVLVVIRIEDYFDMREELQDWRNQSDDIKSEITENNHYEKTDNINKLIYINRILSQIINKLKKET